MLTRRLVAFLALALVAGVVAADDAIDGMTPEQMELEMKKIHDEVEKLRVEHMDSFKSGDIDKDGQLSAPEFVAVQKKDNPESSDEELNQAFADHDTDGSGHLTMEEWNQPFDEAVSEMMHTSSEHAASEDEMMRQHQMEFEGYDKNSDGMLDVDELQHLADHVKQHGEFDESEHQHITSESVLTALDLDADGKVSLEEYLLDGDGSDYDDGNGDENGDDEDDDDLEDASAHDLSIEDLTGDDDLLN